MTPQQLVGIGVRLFAIWLGVASITYLIGIPAAMRDNMSEEMQRVTYAMGVAYVLATLVFWFFPMWVAHQLLPRTKFDNRLSARPHEVARVGAALIGLWFCARALPSLADLVFRAFLLDSAGSTFSALGQDMKLYLADAVFELILGVVLIVKARMFANFVFPEKEVPEPKADDAGAEP